MKPTPLVLACAVALLAPSCKKTENSVDPETPGQAAAGAPTKSTKRQSPNEHGALDPGMDGDPRDTGDLMKLAETIFAERQEISNKLTGAAVEQEISERMGDSAGVENAKGKAADLNSEIHDQDQTLRVMLRKLRSRRESEPDNQELASFVVYLEQMEVVSRKREKLTEAQAASPDEESLKGPRTELAEENKKLRELRAAWQTSRGQGQEKEKEESAE